MFRSKFGSCQQNEYLRDYKNYMCVDLEEVKEYYKLMNGYDNEQNRVSFSIEGSICQDDADSCKDT